MATMADVARLAGVTRSTVSYAISGSRPISQDTRDRVFAAMEQLDYTPNVLAQGLAGRRTRLLGLLLPSEFLGVGVDSAGYLTAAADEARAAGYHLVLQPGPADDPEFVREAVHQGLVDGVVVMEVYSDDARATYLSESRTPFVLLGRTGDTAGMAFCDADFDAAAESALAHLAGLGHRDIALIGRGDLPENLPGVEVRSRASVEEAAARHGVRTHLFAVPQTFAAGWDLLAEVREPGRAVTAVVFHNEPAGLGLVSAAAAAGVAVPQELSFLALHCGPDAGEQSRPRLTSVGPDNRAMARRAVRYLVQRIDGEPVENLQSLSEAEFVDRGSTAPPTAT